MTRYKCPDCKNKTMEKMVYTEERCECGHTNHVGHTPRRFAKTRQGEQDGE